MGGRLGWDSMDDKEVERLLAEASPEKRREVEALLGVTHKQTRAGEKGERKVKKQPLTGYNFAYEITCNTCGKVTRYYFKLEWSEEKECLVSIPLTTPPTEYKVNKQKTRWCDGCREALMGRSQAEVVDLLLSTLKGKR